MLRLISVLKNLLKHPLSKGNYFNVLKRFVGWQVARRFHDYPSIVPFVNDTRIIIKNHHHASTGNYYLGLMEFETMAFILHYLRVDDLFCDIGANIGSFTILASGAIGARSISFEPVPTTFKQLIRNISINEGMGDLVSCYNMGISDEEGELNFTNSNSAENHVCYSIEDSSVPCNVTTLDCSILKHHPNVLKIDVEGFETKVIDGGNSLLKDDKLNVVIIELCGNGEKYNFDEQKLFKKIIEQGFSACKYNPFQRKLKIFTEYEKGDFIFIRDLNLAEKRLRNDKTFKVHGILI